MSALMDGLEWVDAECKSWAVWVMRERDGGVGWKPRSPLTNFGGGGSGGGYGTNYNVWQASSADMKAFDRVLRGLPGGYVRLLMVYYVQAGAGLRRAAGMLGIDHHTKMRRELVKVLRMLAQRLEGVDEDGKGVPRSCEI